MLGPAEVGGDKDTKVGSVCTDWEGHVVDVHSRYGGRGAEGHNTAFVQVEGHLPLFGPGCDLVQVALQGWNVYAVGWMGREKCRIVSVEEPRAGEIIENVVDVYDKE